MGGSSRVLIVGRQRESVEDVCRVLEGVGYIVTSTLDDGVAIDLAGSSDYDALLIEGAVSQPDRRYIATEARNARPELPVVGVSSPRSVLTQLRQAGIKP